MDFLEVLYPVLLICAPIVLVILIGIAVSAIWLKLMDKNIRACPECGRKAAGVIVETITERLENHVDHKRRNPARIKIEKVTDHYQCEFCGHTWTRSFRRTEQIRKRGIRD